jgi:drug/metabolite transporter (DMT)-like permease
MRTPTDASDRHYQPHLALVGVQALFGSLPVIGKVVLAVLPSTALVGFRVAITALVLYIVQRSRGTLRLAFSGDYWRFALLSLFGVVLNQLLFVGGLARTKASNTSLLAVTIPIFTIAVSSVAGTERLRPVRVFGILTAAAGVIYFIDPLKASFSSETTVGDVMIILNSLAYGIYVAMSKDVITRNGAFRSMTWLFIFASALCIPLGLFSLSGVDVGSIDIHIWMLVLYIGVGATAMPYLLNAWALARVNPSTVAVYIYLQPLIGFVLAAIFLGEQITARFMLAAVLIFVGVYLVTRRPVRTEKK